MTQLVELHHVAPELHAAGYCVYAISNDTVDRLAEFSTRHGIDYPLLSDEDSTVIRRFGILNTLIAPDEGKQMRWFGIPYPGTYVIDADGVVRQKHFHQHHARRASGRTLVHLVTGSLADGGARVEADGERVVADGPDVTVAVHLADSTLRLEVLSTLVVRIEIADGVHLYAPGAPKAFTAAHLDVTGEGVRGSEATWPEPSALRVEELGLDVPVWTGVVTVTVPVTATSDLIRLGHGLDLPTTTITVELSYQACDDHECRLPQLVTVDLQVPLDTLAEPEGLAIYVQRVGHGAATERGDGTVR